MIGIGVIGYGYWGPNLVRNFWTMDGSSVRCVADLDERNLERVRVRHPGVVTTRDARELIERSDVDAVAVATPVSEHHRWAMAALRAGKHVLVEKPLASTSEQAEEMVETARVRGLTLAVDHTFPYTGAVRKIKQLVDAGDLGRILYYDSVRVNLGLFQRDVNVIWDLAVHDLAILDFILPDRPVAVSATGFRHFDGHPENVAYLTLHFEDRTIAHIHVNWLSPVKVRQILIGGDRRMIVYDDLTPTEKIRIYDRGIDMVTDPQNIYDLRVNYRSGDMLAPLLETTEALQSLCRHFIDCVSHGKRPLTDGECGARIVRYLEAADRSMQGEGERIKLP